MPSALEIENLDRYVEYRLLVDGQESVSVFPYRTSRAEIPPGTHEVSFRAASREEIPSACKPIRITIQDGKTLRVKVKTESLAIKIYDSEDNQINGIHGFLCGKLADGVYCENPIE